MKKPLTSHQKTYLEDCWAQKINGQVGSLIKPLTTIQSKRIISSALEVLTSASQTYNSWLSANEQIASTLSNLPLSGPDILVAETNLVNIVTQQQQTSLVITARYDEFIGKVNVLL